MRRETGRDPDAALLDGIGMTSRRTRERLVARLRERGIAEPAVLAAMGDTPRHLFLDEALAHRAYEDTALPIGHQQTLSQPYIVARMTELLVAEGRPEKVLEVGTGSGYQAAVLARLAGQVFTVERIAALARLARQRFRLLGLHNVRAKHSDGAIGWSSQAPFDGILVTAAPEVVPDGLLAQLGEGARMVIPVGRHGHQHLVVITRRGDAFERREVEQVSFVPLVGGAG